MDMEYLINIFKRSAVLAVLAVTACSSEATFDDACENVCSCEPEAERTTCLTECQEDDAPSQACIDCAAEASCSEIDSCESVCEDDE